jgi:hypothetical protein
MKELILSIDTLWIAALSLGGFIFYELRAGEVPLRWFGSIKRTRVPLIFWLFILFHVLILGVVIYAWVDGLRVPISSLFD